MRKKKTFETLVEAHEYANEKLIEIKTLGTKIFVGIEIDTFLSDNLSTKRTFEALVEMKKAINDVLSIKYYNE